MLGCTSVLLLISVIIVAAKDPKSINERGRGNTFRFLTAFMNTEFHSSTGITGMDHSITDALYSSHSLVSFRASSATTGTSHVPELQ